MSPRLLLVLTGCAELSAPVADREDREQYGASDEGHAFGGAPPASVAPAPMEKSEASGGLDVRAMDLLVGASELKVAAEAAPESPAEEAPRAPARSWFPESLLWLPRLRTDATGQATVDVAVPGTLTAWRVLALAHSSAGAQAGAELRVQSTLPAYVELSVPSALYAGDRASLPLRVVNQGDAEVRALLETRVDGVPAASGDVTIAGRSTLARAVPVAPGTVGTLRAAASLGELDATERSIAVRPAGRAVDDFRGGSLAEPRTLALPAVPGGRHGRLEVVVFPGADAVVLDAVTGAQPGTELGSAAYAYALATAAAHLDAADVDADRLRVLRLHAWQVLAREARAPSDEALPVLVMALTGAPSDRLEGRAFARLRDDLRDRQRPDGSWPLGSGQSLEVVLWHSARAALALRGDRAATERASAYFERHAASLDVPVLAAAVLASGAAGDLAPSLRDAVVGALVAEEDGTRRLAGAAVGGVGISDREATALGALGMEADPAVRARLASWLLARPSPASPTFADLLALGACADVFGGEVPADVKVRVSVGGVLAAEGILDPRQPRVPITLGADIDAVAHEVRIEATPAVPGLAFRLRRREFVPWISRLQPGLDLRVELPALEAGESSSLLVSVSAPSERPVAVEIGLPAGTRPDAAALDAMVAGGALDSWSGSEGRLYVEKFVTAVGFELGLPVISSIPGTLQAAPARAWVVGQQEEVRVLEPMTWRVAE